MPGFATSEETRLRHERGQSCQPCVGALSPGGEKLSLRGDARLASLARRFAPNAGLAEIYELSKFLFLQMNMSLIFLRKVVSENQSVTPLNSLPGP
jgi:hypothetical protein